MHGTHFFIFNNIFNILLLLKINSRVLRRECLHQDDGHVMNHLREGIGLTPAHILPALFLFVVLMLLTWQKTTDKLLTVFLVASCFLLNHSAMTVFIIPEYYAKLHV